jgi:hypothetical protein
MTTTPPTTGLEMPPPPTVECPRCGDEVPDGAFCGACGSHLAGHDAVRGNIRAHSYAVAPGEHLLQVSLISTFFPQLPHRARAPFRIGVVVLLGLLVGLGLLRLQAPTVAVAAIGVPLLFLIYLYEINAYEDYHWAEATGVLAGGAVLGAVWAHFTGPIVTRALTRNLDSGVSGRSLLVAGILIPAAAQLLMLVPAAVVWLRRAHRTDAMDGFTVGAAGALGFVAASTLTRLWPQLSTGVRASSRGAESVLEEGLLQGVTIPVIAGCGAALIAGTAWMTRRDSVHRGRWATSPMLALLLVLGLQVGLGIADLWQPRLLVLLGVRVIAALLVLLVLRVVMHFVLLHEAHEVVIGPPHVCAHCHHVVPQMPFCPHCGFATMSAGRSHRRALAVLHDGESS